MAGARDDADRPEPLDRVERLLLVVQRWLERLTGGRFR
jgi:hypothetical protein